MQQLRLIKGKSYLIDGIPHLFQERDNGIYRFLKIDGSQKYLYENDLAKVKLTLQDEAYEQRLRDAESEISYYKEKYRWYQEKERQEGVEKKHTDVKKGAWFSGSRFVQISTGLTMATIIVVAFILSIEAGGKSQSFWVGLFTFASMVVGGFIISLLIAWGAFKAEEFIDEEKKLNLIIKLIFFLPVVWFSLFKIFELLFLSNTNVAQ